MIRKQMGERMLKEWQCKKTYADILEARDSGVRP